jgi:hypothetical protein
MRRSKWRNAGCDLGRKRQIVVGLKERGIKGKEGRQHNLRERKRQMTRHKDEMGGQRKGTGH